MSRWVALGGVGAGVTGKDGAMTEPAVTSVLIVYRLRGLECFDRRVVNRALVQQTLARRVITESGVA